MKNPWKTIQSELKYENNWIRVKENKVKTPAGTDGIYGVVHFKNKAIGIIPVDDLQYTYLVGQYRYALDEYSWEIPMGGGPIDTDILDSAKRELIEETGIQALEWTKLCRIHTSNSVTDEEGFIFTARNLSFGKSNPEDTEDLKLKKVHLSEALKMVQNGLITDAISMTGILMICNQLNLH